MKTVLRFSLVLMLLMVVGHAQMLNNFDAAVADTNYWEYYEPVTEGGLETNPAGHYAISTNADPAVGWIHTSFVTDIVLEGTGAMKIDYSVHNSESWGGYSKLHHYYPDSLSTGTYDWTLYDSISFSYYNLTPQDSVGRVHLRLNLGDYGDIEDSAYHDLGEWHYSFHYILDNEPGWNTVTLPLENNYSWDGNGFNMTGWSGVAGNLELDKDRIKCIAFEFSVSGSGVGDVVTGSVILDDLKLTGSRNAITVDTGFESGFNAENGVPTGWGGWMAAWEGWGALTHFATVLSEDAHGGDYYVELGVDAGNGYAVLWPEGEAMVAAQGETWELSAWIKDVSPADPAGDFAALKIEAKDADGNVLNSGTAEMIQTGVTGEWQHFAASHVMPVGTVAVQAILVSTKWLNDGIAAVYAFDDVAMVNLGSLDTELPVAVEGINSIPGTNYNLVTWTENAGEEGETYSVYASTEPITDVTADGVDVIASGHLEGAPSVVHYLYAPLEDALVSYYYAVVCTDAAQNVGPAGVSASAFTNTALGIPTISLDVPTGFVADGFFEDWGDVPYFEMGVTPNSWGISSIWGAVDNDADASAKLYLAIDDEFLYVGVDALDNVYNGYVGDGNWWDMDAFQLFIGLYDQSGPRHAALFRGAEPDYGLVFTNDYLRRDNDGMFTLANQDDGNYYFEGFNPDYVIEARISLDSLATAGGFNDAVYSPTNHDRILIEPIMHDNDGSWEGNVQTSSLNNDNAWQTPGVWNYTFVGDNTVSIGDVETPANYSLSNNYPNPFNPSTMISYEIPTTEQVRLSVYNVLGQEVMVLVNDVQTAGAHNVQFQAGTLASGIYMYRLEAGSFTSTHKMILMK